MIIPLFILLCGLWIGSYIWPDLIPLLYIYLGIYALKGYTQIIQSLSIISLLQLINPGISNTSISSVKWIVVLLPFSWIILRIFDPPFRDTQLFKLSNVHLLFSLLLLPLCLISSHHPIISSLKLFSFAAVGFVILKSFELTTTEPSYWIKWFNTLFHFILFASVVMVFTPYGYFKNGRGFQGIFNHPQVLGVMGGLTAVWFFSQKKNLYKYLYGGGALFLTFLTKARIGFILMLSSICIQVILECLSHKKIKLDSSIKSFLIFTLVIGLPSFLLIENSREIIELFFLKRTPQSNLLQSFGESRGQLIQNSMDNFWRFPLTGIGLGISSDFNYNNVISLNNLGIPFTAPTEKGFMPTAILEELGIIGGILSVCYLIFLSNKNHRSVYQLSTWLFLAALCTNIGEFVFFSFGGLGLFQWLLIGFCCTPDK